jgi:hypothetical protein
MVPDEEACECSITCKSTAACRSIVGPSSTSLSPSNVVVAYLAGWKEVAFLNCWVYIVAPIVGAPLGVMMFVDKVLSCGEEEGDTVPTSHD